MKFSDQWIEKQRRQVRKRHPLLQEVKILKLIQHPHIVQYVDFFQTKDKDVLCLVIEFFSGMNMFDKIIQDGKFTEKDAREIFLQLCSAVSYLHEHNIVQRDLKPDNIMFVNSTENKVKIIDLGLAALSDSSSMKTFCGTLEYTAPEVIRNMDQEPEPYDARLGVILYMMLCKNQPFRSYTVEAILPQIKNGGYDISETFLALSPQARDLIQNLLQVQVEKRIILKQIQNHPWIIQTDV
jgi:calcium/calmodulin-dependent protein kinase I